MSVGSTNPSTQVAGTDGSSVTTKKDGIYVRLDSRDMSVQDVLGLILQKLEDIHCAIQELDNV